MTDNAHDAGATGPSHRSVEFGTAIAMAAFGLVVIYGSLKVGIGWGAEGPKSGFFPFYLGLIIVAASIVNFLRERADSADAGLFAAWSQLRQVMSVVIPTAIYVAVLPWVGIYLASFVLIAAFMVWLGRYKISFSTGIAAGVVIVTYLTFEKWFLVPLPKGPIEELLGL